MVSGAEITRDFIVHLRASPKAQVLELGTRRSNPEISTAHREWGADDATWVLSDFQSGLDVDVVADIHSLSEVFPANRFDFVVACSVFEHVQRPWIASREIAKVLKPGGKVFVQTHFAFPLHGHPNDYWRFTTEALETIFDEQAGFRPLSAGYEFPCTISSQQAATDQGPAYLNSVIVAEKLPSRRWKKRSWLWRLVTKVTRP